MFQALFWKFSPFWPFWPKTVQNGPFWPKWPKMGFFEFFSRTAHQNFLIFCSKHSIWSRKIITFSLFGGNFKNGPVWPKLTQIWPELANLAGCWNSWKSQKNQKVGFFETDFKQVPFVFRQTTCTYSESWRPLENVCDPISISIFCSDFMGILSFSSAYPSLICKIWQKWRGI